MSSTIDTTGIDKVIVWGNCQAAPLADLLRAPLAAQGLHVVDVPPVYLVEPAQLADIRATLRNTAVLVSQPVSDEYRVPGCGIDQLAALLPHRSRVVRLPVVYDVGAFPFQSRGYLPDGSRIDAPVTDYHDLRMIRAAAAGWSVARTVAEWPRCPPAAAREVAAASLAELRRREVGLDVVASDLVSSSDALWTMTHPTNRVLASLAERVLAVLRISARIEVPAREYLGQRRAPLEPAVADALGWPAGIVRPDWVVDGATVALPELAETQLAFYAERPDLVAATLRRLAPRLRTLWGPDYWR